MLAEHGIEFDEDEPGAVELDADEVESFLRELMPKTRGARRAGAAAVGVGAVVAHAAREPEGDDDERSTRSSGLLVDSGARVVRLARSRSATSSSAKRSCRRSRRRRIRSCRSAGRWHALQTADVEKALRFLEQRRTGAGIVDLVRAVSGLETDEAGLELGEVSLDESLTDLLRRRRPALQSAADAGGDDA